MARKKLLRSAFNVKRCILDPNVRNELEDTFTVMLDRSTTKKDIRRFCNYLDVDYPQWITDNAKAFVRDVIEG